MKELYSPELIYPYFAKRYNITKRVFSIMYANRFEIGVYDGEKSAAFKKNYKNETIQNLLKERHDHLNLVNILSNQIFFKTTDIFYDVSMPYVIIKQHKEKYVVLTKKKNFITKRFMINLLGSKNKLFNYSSIFCKKKRKIKKSKKSYKQIKLGLKFYSRKPKIETNFVMRIYKKFKGIVRKIIGRVLPYYVKKKKRFKKSRKTLFTFHVKEWPHDQLFMKSHKRKEFVIRFKPRRKTKISLKKMFRNIKPKTRKLLKFSPKEKNVNINYIRIKRMKKLSSKIENSNYPKKAKKYIKKINGFNFRSKKYGRSRLFSVSKLKYKAYTPRRIIYRKYKYKPYYRQFAAFSIEVTNKNKRIKKLNIKRKLKRKVKYLSFFRPVSNLNKLYKHRILGSYAKRTSLSRSRRILSPLISQYVI